MFGHKLRSLNECLIVGTGTIRKDNPILDCRLEGLSERSPDIFVLDRRLDLKHNLKIFSNKNRKIYIFHSDKMKKKILNSKNIKYIKIKEDNKVLDINTVIRKISDLGYMRVLVEGGSKLSASLLNENLIDEIAWFRASKIMGNKGINAISNLEPFLGELFNNDDFTEMCSQNDFLPEPTSIFDSWKNEVEAILQKGNLNFPDIILKKRMYFIDPGVVM